MTEHLHEALGETAMLAALRTSSFGASRRDRQAGIDVSAANGAVSDAAKVNVNILAGADGLHKEIMGLQRETRAAFNALTSVWDEEGWRILPNANFTRLVGAMKPFNERMSDLKDRLRHDAPGILARAEAGMGDFAKRVKLPTAAEMVEAYSTKLDFSPVPSSRHLPSNLPPATLDYLRKRVETQVENKLREAMREPMLRLAGQLEHFVSRMDAADEREKEGATGRAGSFRTTLVSNLQDLSGVLAAFNLTNDPDFAAITDKMQSMLDGVSVDVLRTSRHARDKAKRDAANVLDALAAYKT